MTFEITDKMIGLTVVNSLDGTVLGVSKRLIFGKKRLEFKSILAESTENDNRTVYVQYEDILRINNRTIQCLTEVSPSKRKYSFTEDKDAFCLVGNDAESRDGRSLGRIVSAQLDSETGIVTSFVIRRGTKETRMGADSLADISRSGSIIVNGFTDGYEDAVYPEERLTGILSMPKLSKEEAEVFPRLSSSFESAFSIPSNVRTASMESTMSGIRLNIADFAFDFPGAEDVRGVKNTETVRPSDIQKPQQKNRRPAKEEQSKLLKMQKQEKQKPLKKRFGNIRMTDHAFALRFAAMVLYFIGAYLCLK